MNGNTSDGVGSSLRARREALELSQLAVALRAECSPAMVGLVDRGYRPHRSAVIERIDRVLSDAEQSTDNDVAPSTQRSPGGNQGFAKTDVTASGHEL